MRAGDTAEHGAGRRTDGGAWRRSSHSGGGNDCVEVVVTAGRVGIRDSKDETGAALWITPCGWRGLRTVAAAKPAS